MARILIDGRFVGVGDSQTRVVLENLREILKLDHANSYTLLIRPQGVKDTIRYMGECKELSAICLLPTAYQNLQVQILDVPHYSLAEQTKLLSYLNHKKYDLVHFTQFNHPIFYRGKYVITIQDLTLIGHLHYFNFIKQLAFNLVMRSAIRDSAKIISISRTTTEDVLDFVRVNKKKISLIYWGIDHELFNLQAKDKTKIEDFKKKYEISSDYILYTGAWKKHKNLQRLLNAFQKFQSSRGAEQPRIQLVLAGKIDQKEPEIIERINTANAALNTKYSSLIPAIIAAGFIEDSELPTAYAGATAYVIPSLNEGFGWPPLEAMACGTPVISSNISCMPEILGDAPLYFDPYDEDKIEKAIDKIVTDKSLQKELVKKGLLQVQKYNWSETAKKTLDIYKSLI